MRHWLHHFSSTRRYAMVVMFVAGALLSFAFAPFYTWPVLFLCLPTLYLLLIWCETGREAIWRGFLFGYGFFMAGTWWIGNALLVDAAKFGWMLPFSILGLSALMALWFIPLGWLVWRARRSMNPAVFTVIWIAIEWLRSLGMFGFPWNLMGYVGLASLPLAQIASIIGVYGLGAFLVWFALFPIYWLERKPRRFLATLACVLFLAACYDWGSSRLHQPTEYSAIKLRVVQPNVPQEIKGSREGAVFATTALEKLTVQQYAGGAGADVIIWPETSYPFSIRAGGPVMLPGFSGVLLTGAVRAEGQAPNVAIWNSLVVLSPEADILATYDKHQLVPFGEFVPLRQILPLDKITPGDTDFSRGVGPQTLSVHGLPAFSPLVCYEAIFPWFATDNSHRPAWLLNITNDGWYGRSAGPYQHFDMARMRAIEQGLPMVRAANSGVSAVIDARGRVVQELGLGQQGVIDMLLPKADIPTLYSRRWL